MANTLISIGQLDDAKISVIFGKQRCILKHPNRSTIMHALKTGGLYRPMLHTYHPQTSAIVRNTKISLADAHRTLAHASYTTIHNAIQSDAITGIDIDTHSPETFCAACIQGKINRKSFPKHAENRAKALGERIHADLWGPASTRSLGGSLYTVDFTDDATRWTSISFLISKTNVLDAYKNFEAQLATEHSTKIKYLRTDRGTEFLNAQFNAHLNKQGTKRELTIHHTHEQVGVTEHYNRTKLELT